MIARVQKKQKDTVMIDLQFFFILKGTREVVHAWSTACHSVNGNDSITLKSNGIGLKTGKNK